MQSLDPTIIDRSILEQWEDGLSISASYQKRLQILQKYLLTDLSDLFKKITDVAEESWDRHNNSWMEEVNDLM